MASLCKATLVFVLLAVFMVNTSSFRSPSSVSRMRVSCSSTKKVDLADKFRNRSLLLEQVIEKLKSKNAALEVISAQDVQNHERAVEDAAACTEQLRLSNAQLKQDVVSLTLQLEESGSDVRRFKLRSVLLERVLAQLRLGGADLSAQSAPSSEEVGQAGQAGAKREYGEYGEWADPFLQERQERQEGSKRDRRYKRGYREEWQDMEDRDGREEREVTSRVLQELLGKLAGVEVELGAQRSLVQQLQIIAAEPAAPLAAAAPVAAPATPAAVATSTTTARLYQSLPALLYLLWAQQRDFWGATGRWLLSAALEARRRVRLAGGRVWALMGLVAARVFPDPANFTALYPPPPPLNPAPPPPA